MMGWLPDYLTIPPEELGKGTPVTVEIVGGVEEVAQHFANRLFEEMRDNPRATLIVPVGPVDQFPLLVEMINRERLHCRNIMLINMDEYLTDDDAWIDMAHPLSFRGFMQRRFYDLLDANLAPIPEHRVFPDPARPERIGEVIQLRGGVDTCYGGIGINGHIAFNEPPEPGESVSDEEFAALPTRTLSLTRETKTINSHTVGGEISIIPNRAVTVGMREILGARRLRFYCNRPWQSAVVRRALHGPITASCPASFLRLHPDATLTIADFVAQTPDIRLR